MDRIFLAAAMLFFLASFSYTLFAFGAGRYLPGRLNFGMLAGGFVLLTVFLVQRGQEIGRCPVTNLFEVLVFLSWSLVLIYMIVGSAYRLSLLGAFTSPLAFLLLLFAVLAPGDGTGARSAPVNAWMEWHAAVSIIAYGAFALAGVAGVMFLLQERQLKTRNLHSFFYELPPITDLATANRRLLVFGFVLLTAGLAAGFPAGLLPTSSKLGWSAAVWLVYAAILAARTAGRASLRDVAALSVGAFLFSLLSLWGVTYLG